MTTRGGEPDLHTTLITPAPSLHYRRASLPGATYFFTLVTAHRHLLFDEAAACDLLRRAFQRVHDKRPFTVNATVVLSDHPHCLWTLPSEDAD